MPHRNKRVRLKRGVRKPGSVFTVARMKRGKKTKKKK